jgi:hypothetical protein
MSADHTPHLSDERLLLLVDGELQPRPADAAAVHLRGCAACRARFEQFERSTARFARAYRDDCDTNDGHAESITLSRGRLKTQLADINSAGHRRPSWLSACAILAAVLLTLQFLSDRSGPAAPDRLADERHDIVRPIAHLTPGATRSVAVADLCARRAAAPRAIPMHVRQAVLRDYSLEDLPAEDYERDYLITPELGGSDDRRNLWPERYSSERWNARVKDELEQLLPTLVCAGTVPLAIAQRDMAADWIAAYKKYFRTDRPLHAYPHVAASRFDPADDDDDRVLAPPPDFRPPRMPTLRYEYNRR